MQVTQEDPETLKFFADLESKRQGPKVTDEQLKIFAPWQSPPEHWRDRESFEFAGFVMHFHEDNCIGCGAVTHWSDTFRAFTRKGDAKTTRMLPATHNIPERASITVFRIPPRQIPVCTHCLTATREGTAVYLISDEAAWNEAKRRDENFRLQQRREATAKRNASHMPMDMNSVPEGL